MVLVAVAVVAAGGFCVYRLHGIFGSNYNTSAGGAIVNDSAPFNPKHVVYEVFGDPGATATITYEDIDAAPQQVLDAALPWKYDASTTQPAVFGNLVAQGNGNTLGCRIVIDGEVKDERIVNEVSAYTFCLDKSG
jgi:hypothetical protein